MHACRSTLEDPTATLGGGDLLPAFAEAAYVTRLDADARPAADAIGDLIARFRQRHPDGVIVLNTIATAGVAAALAAHRIDDAIAWIHELPPTIDRDFGGVAAMAAIDRVSARIVTPGEHCRRALIASYRLAPEKVRAIANGVVGTIVDAAAVVDRDEARRRVRAEIGAPEDACIVLGCGTPERAKGVDLFGALIAALAGETRPVYGIWLGREVLPAFRESARAAVTAAGAPDRLVFAGEVQMPELYYAAADVLAMTSREESAALVVSEAMLFGLPPVYFENTGGVAEQLPAAVSLGVPAFDVDAMAARIRALLADNGRRRRLGAVLAGHARRRSSWRRAAEQILALAPARAVAPPPSSSPLELASLTAAQRDVVSRLPRRDDDKPAILIVVASIEIGGGELNAIRLANALTATHRVFIVNARPRRYDPAVASQIAPDVIPLEGALHDTGWYDAAGHVPASPNDLDERPERLRVLAALIAYHRIDLVQSHVWWADRLTLGVHRLTPFHWLVRFSGCYEGLLAAPEMDPEFPDTARAILERVDGVSYGSPTNLRVFEDRRLPRPRALAQIHNGRERGVTMSAGATMPARRPDDFVFCVVSRAIAEKGWAEAIRAVHTINAQPAAERGYRRARLWLVGDGPVRETLATACAGDPDIHFFGRQQQPLPFLAAADAGLLPSRFVSESAPTSVIETLACGRPVIATEAGAVPDMLECDGKRAGLVVPLSSDGHGVDEAALVQAMLQYLRDPDLYDRHRAAAPAVFDAHFDLGQSVRRYLSFFAATANVSSISAANAADAIGASRA